MIESMRPPELTTCRGAESGVLVWRYDEPMVALSSAPVGGGVSRPSWVLNIQVPLRYARTDLDAHVAEVAADLRLTGPGIGLLTATNIDYWHRATHDRVHVDTTSGVTQPTWAADVDGGWTDWSPGTINIVAHMPVRLDVGAPVNAVMTITEAKTQALTDLGIPGTGTASDAVVVVWPEHATESAVFAGPRSEWGSKLALATYQAVHRTAGPRPAETSHDQPG